MRARARERRAAVTAVTQADEVELQVGLLLHSEEGATIWSAIAERPLRAPLGHEDWRGPMGGACGRANDRGGFR